MTRPLRVFLCHASEDKPAVRELYKRLVNEKWIEPWLDEESLLPGQDFDVEIYKATRDADAIIICLSKVSVVKEGYLNKEIRRTLDIANEKPEGVIYVIPLRLDDCKPSFERLRQLHWVDYFTPNAHEKLVKSLRLRAATLKIEVSEDAADTHETSTTNIDLDLYRFIRIPPTEDAPYSFYIGKYPVTNAQYERFLGPSNFVDKSLWIDFPKYNKDCALIGKWGSEGWDWLLHETRLYLSLRSPLSVKREEIYETIKLGYPLPPRYWDEEKFGVSNPNNPVVGVTWYQANAYCNWLMKHWAELHESRANIGLRAKQIRLPLDFEWTAAAGGNEPENRYPWDWVGKVTTEIKEVARRSNIVSDRTTPVNAYIRGASQFGVMDMAGNVWEWQANLHRYSDKEYGGISDVLSLRGAGWNNRPLPAHVLIDADHPPEGRERNVGFRVVVIPSD